MLRMLARSNVAGRHAMTSSQPPSIQELKRTLMAAGLEIFRTRPDAVHLAERPRDNQILDAGISVRPTTVNGTVGAFEVRVVMRCQRSDFPREQADVLFEKVRHLAHDGLLTRGFREIETREHRMADPGDSEKTLDTWFELVFSRTVTEIDVAVAEAKHALALEKYVKVS
jgi:hypothetical protein